MQLSSIHSTIAAAGIVSVSAIPALALPKPPPISSPGLESTTSPNPSYSAKLEQTISAFLNQSDRLNAARTRTVQKTSAFVWITAVVGLSDIHVAIKEARAVQKRQRKPVIVPLVLYDLPSRGCSAGDSAGEFEVDQNGFELYKKTFIDPYVKKVKCAPDLTFAIILEPGSLGNVVTNMGVPLCAQAALAYEGGLRMRFRGCRLPTLICVLMLHMADGWGGMEICLLVSTSTQSATARD
jgi:cellulose 1,4-beta-cellobiosidase